MLPIVDYHHDCYWKQAQPKKGKQDVASGLSSLKKPQRLKRGDTIGIVAPSSPFEKAELDAGMAVLREMGFRLHLADGLYQKSGYLAGSDVSRARQLNSLLGNDEVCAVMCARGGFGALKILAAIDYDKARTTAKPFIGFSDITAIHQALLARAGMVVFHGPTVCSIGKGDGSSRQRFYTAVSGQERVRLQLDAPRVLHPGRAKGPVVGGNLATLCHLLGTGYFPDLKGRILLLEDTNEAIYRIDRMLTQMAMAGCFEGLGGLVLGDFTDCGDSNGIDAVFRSAFEGMDIPVLAGMPVGHGRCNATIPLGLGAVLDTDSAGLFFEEAATLEPGGDVSTEKRNKM